ncbi:hypothetical protein [Malaciobacter mytili]|uniref:Uncharacterized protein n=1 Tax=Malaciobacter mytili LMG 24559 TaxID=1032238 RepID=A0AAX2AFN1_9BACT|nr:hypothetical protein [Malaciobacter mytili]AXH15723.1 hypothetical protein AMYT_2177 [Malaciobacter mytili LMG 24559]RXI38956.1 hypothetical protein CRU99_11065 [Malaciobacter mytili]RXK15455.1 hypothetical protein CP985_08810 [Malaciobacter mytili LMG 24559]
MFNISLSLVGQVAKTAAFGAIATKVIDTFILSKVNNKIDQKRWLRQSKLEAFTKLSQEILSIDLNNPKEESLRSIKEYSAKTILLLEDRVLINTIEDYLTYLVNLNKTCHDSSKNMLSVVDKKGINLVMALNKNLKKV